MTTPPCPEYVWLNGWQSTVFTIDNCEAFRLSEFPPTKYVWDELSPDEQPPAGMNRMRYEFEMLTEHWQPKTIQ